MKRISLEYRICFDCCKLVLLAMLIAVYKKRFIIEFNIHASFCDCFDSKCRPHGCFEESCWPKWLFNGGCCVFLHAICNLWWVLPTSNCREGEKLIIPISLKTQWKEGLRSKTCPYSSRITALSELWTLSLLSFAWKIYIKLHSFANNYEQNTSYEK